MLNPRPDTGIDLIFNLNTEATSLVDVTVTTIAEPPLMFVTTLPPPPTPLITHMQQAPVPTPTIVLSSSLDEAHAENEAFLNSLDENIKKIIKDQVKQQVKAQVSKILPRIEKSVNKQLEAEALVEAYESDKLILDTYGDTVSFKRHRDDEDKDEEPFAGLNWGSKRRRAGKEPKSTSAPKEKTSKTTGKLTDGSKSQHKSAEQSDEETSQHPDWFQKPAKIPTLDLPHESFDELMDTPLDFSAFMMNRLKIDTLTPELLVGPTFELMKGTCKSLVELEYFFEEVYKATTDQLDWHNPEVSPVVLMQLPSQRPRLHIMVISNGLKIWSPTQSGVKESAHDVYLKRRIIAVTKLQIVKWHGYKHLDWITVRRDDDKLYTLKEGDFKRLRLQDIKDMLILLVQGKLTNLNVEDRLAFGVSLRMFTRSIVIQRHVKDLQLGVESYQKKLNITKPDTYISDIKRRDAYTT
ncbi:hypothetical protein Tco_1323346, partial [Tanacetum coccineum]